MARRRWTVRIAERLRTAGRRLRVSHDVRRALIAVTLLAMAGLFSAAATRVLAFSTDAPLRVGSRVDAVVAAELEAMRTEVAELRASLDELAAKDEYFRMLAGLEPIHDDPRAVGVGGPASITFTRHPLNRFDEAAAERMVSLSTEVTELLRRARTLSVGWREAKDTLQSRYDRLAAMPSISPVDGYVSSGFSYRRIHPILNVPRPHLGLDIAANHGTPIVATARGRVRFVGYDGEYGLAVEIDHGFGHVTRYTHASRAVVRKGQPVERGDVIARVGETGLALGPHVHYELLVNGRKVNPRNYILDIRVIPD
ncbi:MAG: peptidoglycan DD-metalloendopeptidase family protein [Longimicrobiales bacterium]